MEHVKEGVSRVDIRDPDLPQGGSHRSVSSYPELEGRAFEPRLPSVARSHAGRSKMSTITNTLSGPQTIKFGV